ncbi:MAG: DEAD/DEAH box helicase family protein, partial [Deltaproteobacteria bacterium]|nr:DEAD/DEAH box helicase family protein [Deltaproteobacteria bacterium]
MNRTEAKTRQDLIDKKIEAAGWTIKDKSQVIEELDISLEQAGFPKVAEPKTPYEGHRFVDYGLLHNSKPIAVIEAKKTSRDAQLGQEQAFQYAQLLQKIHGGPIPFIFYTNGYDIYFWESDFYPPVRVYGFPSRDDLEWLAQRRASRNPLSVEMINTTIVERAYQIAAIRSVLEDLEKKKKKFLLVMATGTGKTRVSVALCELLMRAKWAKRILFLVDRIALQEQALNTFKDFMPSEPRWPTMEDRNFVKNRRIYVTTYPSMLNLIQSDRKTDPWLSPYFFDVIVADESHRSIYNVYKNVLNYFHGIKIGLTATPKDHVDFDTFNLFDCPMHEPTSAYTFEEAISHKPPYLCDFEVLNVRTKFQIKGIRGKELPEDLQTKLLEEGWELEEIDFEGTDLERKVTNAGTNALIVREFMEESIKDGTGTLPGKSIIFAMSKAHARRLQDIFDKMYPEHMGKLARVLVSEDSRVYGKGGLLEQFKTKDMPRVAISVDMLDTGVDVLEIVNLVFAKPVYSFVKFWQMIGRGTRILENDPKKRKAWCREKDKFLI